jgi:hypothetical protein
MNTASSTKFMFSRDSDALIAVPLLINEVIHVFAFSVFYLALFFLGDLHKNNPKLKQKSTD